MTVTYDFDVPIPIERAMDMFNDPALLDAVHGEGMWSFAPWRDDGEHHLRRGTITGVCVPSCARSLNGGKKHITCTVKQRYARRDDTIVFISTLKPRLVGAPIAKNKTFFTMTPSGSMTRVQVTATNTCYLPPPLNALAKECMNQSTDETIACLRGACEDRTVSDEIIIFGTQ